MKKVYYYHGTLNDGTRYTAAGVFDNKAHTLTLAFAICSERDQFSKKTGRIKSLGRLMSTSDKGELKTKGILPTKKYWIGREGKVFLTKLHGIESRDTGVEMERADFQNYCHLLSKPLPPK